ncbi:hypothetical protein ACWD6R_39575 [Streptomyces sp. NPDC005151]
MLDANVAYIAPAPAARVPDSIYAALNIQDAQVMDYTADRDRHRPAEERDLYRVLEDTHRLAGPRKSDPSHTLRRILVHSTSNARGQEKARTKRLARAAEDLDKLQRQAGGRYYGTAENIAARIGVIARTPGLPAHHHRRQRGEPLQPSVALRPGRPRRRSRS